MQFCREYNFHKIQGDGLYVQTCCAMMLCYHIVRFLRYNLIVVMESN